MRVLIVEDDDAIASPLAKGLEREGLDVDRVETGSDALAHSAAIDFDVVLLDLGLPDRDGFDVCRELRARSDVPIIVVTARSEEVDRVVGLELGADDYIVKPFDHDELVARLHAVLRRHFRGEQIHVQDLTIDPYLRHIERDGKTIDLTPREYEILWALIQASGRPVSEKELLKRLWGINFDPTTNLVQVHVFRLRKKLETGRKPMIDTVRGEGYRLKV
jgi:two-component system response regulator RegX3